MSAKEMTPNERMQLAAVIDRLIYGSETTFYQEDAAELLQWAPPQKSFFRFDVIMKRKSRGQRSRGIAAGVGNVDLKDEKGRVVTVDTEQSIALRVGQWKIVNETSPRDHWRGRVMLLIEQMMSHEMSIGTAATITYVAGRAIEMRISRDKELRIPLLFGRLGIGYVSFVPWKKPADHPRPGTEPYELGSGGNHEGAAFACA